MSQAAWDNAFAALLSLIVHAGAIALLVVSYDMTDHTLVLPPPTDAPVQAAVVDENLVSRELDRLQAMIIGEFPDQWRG